MLKEQSHEEASYQKETRISRVSMKWVLENISWVAWYTLYSKLGVA